MIVPEMYKSARNRRLITQFLGGAKMFLGRLWVRIRGEFLAARENVAEGWDSRKTGERILKRIETVLRGDDPECPRAPEPAEETYQSSSGQREIHDLVDENYPPGSVNEMEKNPDELKKAQDKKENALSEPARPNPRKLG